jgi:hypothetical protein
MHRACQIAMLELGIVPGAAFKSALVRVKLMFDSSACWRKLFACADPTENTRRAQSITSYSPLSRSLTSALSMRG